MKKTIKIIDLYNIIADGQIPKKIKYNTRIYEYDAEQDDYSTFVISHYEYLLDDINVTSQLNDEVEILDEDEFIDIEELDVECDGDGRIDGIYMARQEVEERKIINDLIKNQKKIIKKLREEGVNK